MVNYPFERPAKKIVWMNAEEKKKECLKAVLSPRNAPHLLIRMPWQSSRQSWSCAITMGFALKNLLHSMAIRGSGVGSVMTERNPGLFGSKRFPLCTQAWRKDFLMGRYGVWWDCSPLLIFKRTVILWLFTCVFIIVVNEVISQIIFIYATLFSPQ